MLSRNSTSFLINNSQQHILVRNSIVLPLTSLEIQVSHKLCINPKSLIISSKHTFQLRDAYSSPPKDCWSFAYLLASFRIDKNFPVVSHTTFPQENRRGNNVFDILSAQFHK